MPAHRLPVSSRYFLAESAADMAALGQIQLSGDELTADPDSWATVVRQPPSVSKLRRVALCREQGGYGLAGNRGGKEF